MEHMQINRKFIYLGVFLVAIGAVLVLADLDGVNEESLVEWLRLWPLAVLAIGVGIVLRRTRYNVAGGVLAAALPGLVLGGAFAIGPQIPDCGAHREPGTFTTREGTFDGPAIVDVATGCGSLVVSTAPGDRWLIDAGNTANRPPSIEASGTSLTIDGGDRHGWRGFDAGRDVWRLTLPTAAIDALTLAVHSGSGEIDLTGARLGQLAVTTNAGQTTVDLGQTTLDSIEGTVNAGRLAIDLPSTTDVTGSVTVNAGALDLCVPEGVGLRVRHSTELGSTSVNDEEQDDGDWESPGFATAAHRADLSVTVNFGSVNINPTGGCK
jgi:hypothetical protein